MTDPLALVYLLPRSTLNHHPPGHLLQLFHLAEMGYQQQLWIILYLFLVKRNSPFNLDVSSRVCTAALFIDYNCSFRRICRRKLLSQWDSLLWIHVRLLECCWQTDPTENASWSQPTYWRLWSLPLTIRHHYHTIIFCFLFLIFNIIL